MPTEDSFGPDGFPLCHQCGQQRRTDNAAFPGLCAECIAKLPDDERAAKIRETHGGEPPASTESAATSSETTAAPTSDETLAGGDVAADDTTTAAQ